MENRGWFKKGHVPHHKGKKKEKICLYCKKKFESGANGQISSRKYCSNECARLSGSRGFQKGQRLNESHHNWKGDRVGYFALHSWIRRRLGQPKECTVCGENDPSKRYEWANISKEYKRDITDWQRMCKKCHNDFDQVNVLQNSRRLKIGVV